MIIPCLLLLITSTLLLIPLAVGSDFADCHFFSGISHEMWIAANLHGCTYCKSQFFIELCVQHHVCIKSCCVVQSNPRPVEAESRL